MPSQVNIVLGGVPGPVSGAYSFDQNPLPLWPATATVTYVLLVVVVIKMSMILKFTYLTTLFTAKAVVVEGKDT